MVRSYLDKCHSCYSCSDTRQRKPRYVSKLPVSDRLQSWIQRVADRTAFMRKKKSETYLRLPKSIAEDLGLRSPEVVLSIDPLGFAILQLSSRTSVLCSLPLEG